MKRLLWLAGLILGGGSLAIDVDAGEGGAVAVVYNRSLPESRKLAEDYARLRNVPVNQVFGLDLPSTETMTRREFRERLQKPLLNQLEKTGLIRFREEPQVMRPDSPLAVPAVPLDFRIRYLALCHGVPLKILNDASWIEPGSERNQEGLRKNEAAVDSELAVLPASRSQLPGYGPLVNPLYATTNAASLNPANGVLMVARLDGPSVEIARGLIEKAIQAETDGLWGRAYFDARGLTNSHTKLGDDWIKGAAEVTRRLGYETLLDNRDERFPVSYPMSQIAFYAGWYEYDGQVSGPFTRSAVEFMPGAFAYHLHSFSAQTIRSSTQYWVGPLLQKGVTATMGTVFEPYLEFTPNMAVFFHRFVHLGFSLGEAAYASQSCLSWQTTVVGDPLYRPFARKPQARHEELVRNKNPLAEWSHLKVVNINLATELPVAELIQYLEKTPELSRSAVLQEKLGDLHLAKAEFGKAIEQYRLAFRVATSPQQRVRLLLAVGRTLELFASPEQVYEAYRDFVRAFPEYPDLAAIYRKLMPLADRLKKAADRELFQRELDRLGTSNRSKS